MISRKTIPAPEPSGRVYEVRLGRNWIRRDDYCWIRSPIAGRRGYPARFQYADPQPSGRMVATVFELEGGRYRATRCVPLEQIQRKTKDPYR